MNKEQYEINPRYFGSENLTLKRMREIRKNIKVELRRLPEGYLLIDKRDGYIQFLRVMETKKGKVRVGISKKPTMIYALAHKAFLERLLLRLEKNIELLERAMSKMNDVDPLAVAASMPKNYKCLKTERVIDPKIWNESPDWPNPVRDHEIEPINALLKVTDMTQAEWAAMPYCENTSHMENKIHCTSRGVSCRAKGEAAIMEICDRHGYFYHYDETIYVNGKLISPDFILMKPDGTLIYVEHRGWYGNQYDKHNLWKDWQYGKVGIIQGRNYLVTFENEDGSIDLELIERQLVSMMGY